jgi:phosphatidylinositol alpha-1,6-mannosyltransferase
MKISDCSAHQTPNVLMVSASFFLNGGIERYNRMLVKALWQLGFRIDLISLADPPEGTSDYVSNKVVVAKKLTLWARIRFVWLVFSRLLFKPYDYVICAHMHLIVPVGAGCRLTKKRLVVCTHGDEVWNRPRLFTQFFSRNAYKILTVSQFTRDKLIEKYRLDSRQIELVSNCVDEFFPHKAPPLDILINNPFSGHLMLLSVGRVSHCSEGKGYRNVIELLPSLLKIEPSLIYVIVGGGDGIKKLNRFADELGVGRNVQLTGALSDEALLRHYQLCDIFVLPSGMVERKGKIVAGEGFGITYIEAASQGKPVIGIREGGVPEAVQDGVTGFLIDPEKPDELGQKLTELIKNAPLRKQMGEAGRKWVEENFTFNQFKLRVEKLFPLVVKKT